jgi:filamentous hemagglutinin
LALSAGNDISLLNGVESERTIDVKVRRQAPNIVINLEDSSLSISDVAQFIQRNSVDKLESLIIIKDGNVVLLKGI